MVDANNILVFDRAQLRNNRRRCAARLSQHGFLLDWTNEQLMENLSMVNREFPLALQIGAKTPQPPHASEDNKTTPLPPEVALCKIKDIVRMDLDDRNAGGKSVGKKVEGLFVQGDEELLPFADNSFELVLSNLNLHSINDLPGTLAQIRRILKPDGLFLAAMFGGETLHELRESLMQTEISLKGGASPRVFPFADKQQMGDLMQRAGFALPVIDSDILTVTYDNMFKLLHDLRGMGEGNIIRQRSKVNPGKKFFAEAGMYYQENYAEEDGRIPASFEIIFLSGWAPHASQQQPLKPGSADVSLAEILETAP